MEHTAIYIGSLLICLLFTAILFAFNIRYWKLKFRNPMMCIYLLLTITIFTSIVWAVTNGNPHYKHITLCMKIIEFCCHSAIIYAWYLYCIQNVKTKFLGSKLGKALCFIPIAFSIVLILSAPWTGITFFVNEAGEYVRGPLYAIHLFGYIFLFGCSLAALLTLHNSVLRNEREKLTSIALFPIFPMVLGSVNLALPVGEFPILHFSMVLSLMLVLLSEQSRRITLDGLTGLINRNRFEQIIKNKISHHKESSDESFFVILGDLDNFKLINDKYGHVEGDRTICLVAKLLDSVSKKYSAVVAHISGDEFYIIMDKCGEEGPTGYINDVYSEFNSLNSEVEYNLSISFGVAKYTSGMTLKEIINLADSKMYQIKQQRKKDK